MNDYPEVVARIAGDYVERVKAQLRRVPAVESEEFLREIQSHIYEAYQSTPGEDDVTRILTVLRNFGEPAEVVADRLPEAMLRTGTKRRFPMYLIGGMLIALVGIPLGFGGAAVLAGMLFALMGFALAYYAVAGMALIWGVAFVLLGLSRIYRPGIWDKLVTAGIIQMDADFADLFNNFSSSEQGFMIILLGSVLAAAALGALWLGKYLVRGLRFFYGLVFDRVRLVGKILRTKLRDDKGGAFERMTAFKNPSRAYRT